MGSLNHCNDHPISISKKNTEGTLLESRLSQRWLQQYLPFYLLLCKVTLLHPIKRGLSSFPLKLAVPLICFYLAIVTEVKSRSFWYQLWSLLEKAKAPHSSTLAWKIPWVEEPGGLQSMGSLRVGHDWATSLSLFTFMRRRRKWQPTPVFLPGESQGWGSLVGCRLWGLTELDTTEVT